MFRQRVNQRPAAAVHLLFAAAAASKGRLFFTPETCYCCSGDVDGSGETDRKAADTKKLWAKQRAKICPNRQEELMFTTINALFPHRDLTPASHPLKKKR